MSTEPQNIIGEPTEAAIFLVLLAAGGQEQAVLEALADVPGLKRSVGFRIPEGQLSCVVGIGSEFWDRALPEFGAKPSGLHPFVPLAGARHSAVATPGDLLFHIRARRMDLCFELAQRLVSRFDGLARVVDEVHGFRSFDERDLLGFVDGTENPEGEAARDAILIGDEDTAFAGGSYAVVQKYLHDISAWDALPVEHQELAIGRTKLSDIELPDELKPADSHVALTTIVDDDGVEHQIIRYNMPFGRVSDAEFGTYFIGYARDPWVIEEMLRNMFLGVPPAAYDRILDFSTAVTGTLFFVPPLEMLDSLPESLGQASARPATGPDEDDGIDENDGSLGIGSLKGAST